MPAEAGKGLGLWQGILKSRDDSRHHRRRLQPPRRRGGERCDGDEDRRPDGSLPSRAGSVRRDRHAGSAATFSDPLQLQPDIVRGLHARVRILREACAHEIIERGRYRVLDLVQRRRVLVEDRRKQARLALALERLPSGEHLEQNRTKRKDVGAGVGIGSLDLFRRHVLHRAENRSTGRQRPRRCDRCRDGIVGDGGWRGDFGQAEVEQLGDQMFVCMPPTAGARDRGVL